MDEAISSHIGGWFRSAATSARIHPMAQPDYEYDLPESAEGRSRSRPPSPCSRRWNCRTGRRSRCRAPTPRCRRSSSTPRSTRYGLGRRAGARGGPAGADGDVVVVDVVSPSGEARRDMVVELGTWPHGRRARGGPHRHVARRDEGRRARSRRRSRPRSVTVTLNEIKEKVLPPADDDLARAASEFDTLAELARTSRPPAGADRGRDRRGFRAATADILVQASGVSRPAHSSTRARTSCSDSSARSSGAGSPRDVSRGLRPDPRAAARPAARRGALSVARELVLDAVPTSSASRSPTRRSRRRSASRARPRRRWPR